jgi:ribose 5-phosphate isomerase B
MPFFIKKNKKMNITSIAIGSDHAGFEYKESIVQALINQGISVFDIGPHGTASVDYPDFGHPVANAVEEGKVDFGIVLCGSGNGIAMTVNKHQNIRCALCWTSEIVSLARQHNNANILAIPARFVSLELALEMVSIFTTTNFEGGRHQLRVDKIKVDSLLV